MTTDPGAHEGSIPFAGFQTWYRIVGEQGASDRLPLLLLHGGPAVPHECLEPLEGLASTGRRLIFYDQLGCGNSISPPDPPSWSIDLFRREVDAVRRALALDRVHIFGHSWGGMLAMEYALTQPDGIMSLVLSDTTSSWPEYQLEQARLQRQLPEAIRTGIERHETAGTTTDPEYQDAASFFPRRHVFGMDQPPAYLEQAMQKAAEHAEMRDAFDGMIRGWDISARLGEIGVPTLVLVGRHGLVTPALSETIAREIPRSTLVIFEKSAHFPYINETARYLETVERFLTAVEGELPESR